MKNGFFLVKASNHAGRKDGRIRNIAKCDRWGVFKSQRDPNTPSPRLNRTTKKCDCKFAIMLVEAKDRRGTFAVMPHRKYHRGFHNHPFIPYHDGHWRKSGLSDEMDEFVVSQSLAQVQPKNIKLSLEKKFNNSDPNFCEPTLKKIYNIRHRERVKARGERNPGQQMLHLAVQNGYIFFHQSDESGYLTHIFMCHPEAAKMYRAYPYVVIMDATYKTNQYELPVVEMVGVTPVGKNFLIAYALVAKETTAYYTWVLKCLKDLLPDDAVNPRTIVTDRELSLIAAIPAVFPDADHLLCIWHIYNAVETRASQTFDDAESAYICAYGLFARMVNADTEDHFNAAYLRFRTTYATWQGLCKYVRDTWMKYVEKWAKCYTNNVLHFQNVATSRVESAHALLKAWIGNQTVGCERLWMAADEMMHSQHSSVRKLLSDSSGRTLTDLAGKHARLFSHLSGKVSVNAIKLMRDEVDRGVCLGEDIDANRLCALKKTHGLACACRLNRLDIARRRGDLSVDVHVF